MRIRSCLTCAAENSALVRRNPSEDAEDGLYICARCGGNAFEFFDDLGRRRET